jgi:hypothetical protein
MNNDSFGINTPTETVMIHPVSMNEIPEVVDIPNSLKSNIRNAISQSNMNYNMPNPMLFANILDNLGSVLGTGNFTKSQVEQISSFVSETPEVYGFDKSNIANYAAVTSRFKQVKSKIAQAYIDLGLTNEIKYGEGLKEMSSLTKSR